MSKKKSLPFLRGFFACDPGRTELEPIY
jgi:hypothetical protein